MRLYQRLPDSLETVEGLVDPHGVPLKLTKTLVGNEVDLLLGLGFEIGISDVCPKQLEVVELAQKDHEAQFNMETTPEVDTL